MKKTMITITIIIIGLIATIVAAIAADSDGGNNPFTPGYCVEEEFNGSRIYYYDYCINYSTLREYYPVEGMICEYEDWNCGLVNKMCDKKAPSCVGIPAPHTMPQENTCPGGK